MLLALSSTGCSVGMGSAYVGQWRARDEVVFRACREDDSGRCVENKEVVRHVPERTFTGVSLPLAAMGASFVTHRGETTLRYRIEPSLEVLHGRGSVAWGVRTGAVIDVRGAISVPAMGVAHYSILERLGIYGAAGVIPYARRGDETGVFGARGLIGLQWAFARGDRETFWILNLEADTLWVKLADSYRSTGITGHVGLFF